METKRSHLLDKDKNLVGIKVETEKEVFTIPVADTRVNEVRANKILKAANIHKGSKFLRPSYSGNGLSYQVSQKHL